MWVARDQDSTVYFFGTFHALKPEMDWRSDKMEAAFAQSDEVWLEMSDMDDTIRIASLGMKYGLDLQHPLSTKLSPEDQQRLKEAAATLGLSATQLEIMRPWLAANAIAMAPLIKAGYDPAMGVDQILNAEAQAKGKVVKGFETAEQQMRIFADMPREIEVTLLSETLEDAADGPKLVDGMAEAWLSGDLEQLSTETTAEMEADAPELYRILISNRNQNWADQVVKMMQGSGTHFIAVGAAHLIGDESLQKLLEQRGIEVEPY